MFSVLVPALVPPAPLYRLSINEGIVAPAARRHESPAERSLSAFMRQPPRDLVWVLQQRLPADLLEVQSEYNSEGAESLVVTPRRV